MQQKNKYVSCTWKVSTLPLLKTSFSNEQVCDLTSMYFCLQQQSLRQVHSTYYVARHNSIVSHNPAKFTPLHAHKTFYPHHPLHFE